MWLCVQELINSGSNVSQWCLDESMLEMTARARKSEDQFGEGFLERV